MTAFDISDTLSPKSDQLDAVDLRVSGPRTFTVAGVRNGSSEQPLQIDLAEFDRPWRPGVSMRRVLAYCWGNDASVWVGRKVRLFCDETVTFGSERPGGIRVFGLSDIAGKQSVPLLIKRGKSGVHVVEPLTESAPVTVAYSANDIAACDSIPTLRSWWKENWNARNLDRYANELESGHHDQRCEQRERFGLCGCRERKRLAAGRITPPTLMPPGRLSRRRRLALRPMPRLLGWERWRGRCSVLGRRER